MEPQLSTLDVLEVIERLDELKKSNQNLATYTVPSVLNQAAVKFSSGQKELLGALIARELEKSSL